MNSEFVDDMNVEESAGSTGLLDDVSEDQVEASASDSFESEAEAAPAEVENDPIQALTAKDFDLGLLDLNEALDDQLLEQVRVAG